MTITFSLLSELRRGKSDWAVKVRIARKWKIPADNKLRLHQSIELIVIDSVGERIQVTIPTGLMNKYDDQLKEYNCYYGLSNLFVVENNGFKVTNHQYKLLIMSSTDVYKLGGNKIPRDKVFNLRTIPEVLSMKDPEASELIDVIGRVATRKELKTHWYNKAAKGDKYLELELEDTRKNKIGVTLWQKHAEKMLEHIEQAGNAPLVVLLQLVKAKTYDGKNSLGSAYFESEIYIRSWIPEFLECKRFFDNDTTSSHKVSEMSTSANVSSFSDVDSGNIDVKSVADLKTFTKEGIYWIVGHITQVFNDGWNFPGCFRCKKKLDSTPNGYHCKKCDRIDRSPTLRYRVKVSIISGNESGSFILWDDACFILIGKTAMELKEQYVKKGKEKGDSSDESSATTPIEIMSLVGKSAIFKVKLESKNISGTDKFYSIGTLIDDKEVVDKHLKTNLVTNKKDEFLAALKDAGEEVIEIEDSVSENEDVSPNSVGTKRRVAFSDDTATSINVDDGGSTTKVKLNACKAVKIEKE